jgi:transposase
VLEHLQRAENQLKKKFTLPYTSAAERQTMNVLVDIGHSHSEVATLLNCSKYAVQRKMAKFKRTQTFCDLKKNRKAKQVYGGNKKSYSFLIEEDRRKTSTKLSSLIKEKFGVDLNPIELLFEDMDREIKKL